MYFLPFAKKSKLKFVQDPKACWLFCFELNVSNESNFSMPWVRCAFVNVSIKKYWFSQYQNKLSYLFAWNSSLNWIKSIFPISLLLIGLSKYRTTQNDLVSNFVRNLSSCTIASKTATIEHDYNRSDWYKQSINFFWRSL